MTAGRGKEDFGASDAGTERRAVVSTLAGFVLLACAALAVALALSGTGLLVPSQQTASWTRVAGIVAAVGCLATLIIREGPATTAARLVTVAGAGALVGALSFPASPVALTFDEEAFGPGDDAITDGSGDTTVDGVGGGSGPAAAPTQTIFRLPSGAGVDVAGDAVTVTLDGGSSVVVGNPSILIGDDVGIGTVVVIDNQGTLQRSDGGALGPSTPLGGVTFELTDGAQVVVADGTLLPVPGTFTDGSNAGGGGDEETETDQTDAILAMLLGAFALLAFAPPLVRFGERVAVAFVDPEPVVGPDGIEDVVSPSVEASVAAVLRDMMADPDPRTAVIGAYGRLLAAFAEAGHPRRAQEGPHEHLWRILGPLGVRRQPVHRLAELFVRARFTPKPITEEHRQRAIGALADTVADLRLRADDVDAVARSLPADGPLDTAASPDRPDAEGIDVAETGADAMVGVAP